jgi:hypothetical protein
LIRHDLCAEAIRLTRTLAGLLWRAPAAKRCRLSGDIVIICLLLALG